VSKNVAVFVDVANLYYSARGQDTDVDYVALLKAATKGRDLIRAYAYSGLDPENENQRKFIDFLNKNGYKVVHKDIRKFGDGRVKANLDIELVVDLFRLADRMDIAVVISGDGDFAPAIRALQDKGVRCEVISFRPNTSSDLIAVADEFIDIMKIIGIGRGSKEKEAKEPRTAAARIMSAPEMPAKEVVPEFGFREASPSVAAAALAALREGNGGGSGAGRARGRARTRPAAASAAETVATGEAPVAAAVVSGLGEGAEGEAKRRRRRRGGRGRGRGGRGATVEAGSSETIATPEETGWTELDDLSQLDDLGEEREYTFEEADAATLAELGLLDQPAGADEVTTGATAGTPAEEPARPRRRTRTPRSAKAASGGEAASGDEAAPATKSRAEPTTEEKPKRRRTRATKPAAGDEPSGEASSEASTAAPRSRARRSSATADKPAPRRRTASGRSSKDDTGQAEAGGGEAKPTRRSRSPRSSAAAEAAGAGSTEGESGDGEGGDDAQGIWKRFRSARG
jgi:uncharacterized LabA/DUF88 family protein